MNGVCVIYDNDEKYAKRLMNVMSCKNNIPYGIQIFTKEHELFSYLDQHKPDMMLISEDCYSYEVKQRKEGKVIVLTDEQDNQSNMNSYNADEAVGVYKYQSSEQLLKEVIKLSNCNENRKTEQIEIIGVFTPIELSARATFSLNLARSLAETHQVLYISLDEFSGLNEIIPARENITLSDVVYYFRQNNGHIDQRMLGSVCSVENVDYIAPVQCADDISYIEPEQLIDMIQQIAVDVGYEKVVIDIGYAVKQQWRILQSCSHVYMPVRSDYISSRKTQAFELHMINQGMEKVLNVVQKVTLPQEENETENHFWEHIKYSEMYQYTQELVKRDF